MKKIAKVLQIYFVLQLDLQNSLGCAGTKPRQSITRSSKIISNNLENATEQLVEETNKFKAFQIRYNKSYSDAKEKEYRFKVFCDNLNYINKHNKETHEGKHSFTLGIQRYADLTHKEWHLLQFQRDYMPTTPREENYYLSNVRKYPNANNPKYVDWRRKGYVTPVKDQGVCGSCWAHAATGTLEGALFRKTGKLLSLSEQNLVDCDQENSGCKGGLEVVAFDYVMEHGINLEEDYPYEGQQKSCRFNSSRKFVPIEDYISLREKDEIELTNYLATSGPIPVGIDAGPRSFQHYKSGVYYDRSCKKIRLNHSVLLVGYGSDENGDYYIMKNSWGTKWGDNGYMKMARNKQNACGIASDATVPIS